MSSVIEKLERSQLRRLPDFGPGDRVRVHFQVIEGSRSRTQVFEGVVIARQGQGVRETITVRKQSFGVGVERTFPLHSPKIEQIEVAARGDVRRAKLYYLRDRIGRRSRVRERTDVGPEEAVDRELLEEPAVVGEDAEGLDAPEAVEAEQAEGVEETVEADASPEEAEPAPEAEAGPEAQAEAPEAAAESDAPEAQAEAPEAEVPEAEVPEAEAPDAEAEAPEAEVSDADKA